MNALAPFSERLLSWFDQEGRKDLPWQVDKTPYRVWVSEIMLQQTQVSSVIDYYRRFMQRFPTLETLAQAEEDDVLEHWAGLGYYARARNLLKCAQTLVTDHGGDFPETLEDVIALPGIGRSTAGAILSIARNERHPILDGNVKRVLCRHYAIETWSGERKTEQMLWRLADELTPAHNAADYTQAIMDLGATLCTRSKPDCTRCPVKADCQALANGQQDILPVSRPKKTIPQKATWVSHIETDDGYILLEKRPPSGIWGSLYSLPEYPVSLDAEQVVSQASQNSRIEPTHYEIGEYFQHTFSHYKLSIQPVRIIAESMSARVRETDAQRWVHRNDLSTVGMPAPIARYLTVGTQGTRSLPLDTPRQPLNTNNRSFKT